MKKNFLFFFILVLVLLFVAWEYLKHLSPDQLMWWEYSYHFSMPTRLHAPLTTGQIDAWVASGEVQFQSGLNDLKASGLDELQQGKARLEQWKQQALQAAEQAAKDKANQRIGQQFSGFTSGSGK